MRKRSLSAQFGRDSVAFRYSRRHQRLETANHCADSVSNLPLRQRRQNTDNARGRFLSPCGGPACAERHPAVHWAESPRKPTAKTALFLTLLCSSAVSRAPKNTEHSQTFPSTEIFSKRRKIYATMKRNSSCTSAPSGLRAPSTIPLCSPRVIWDANSCQHAFHQPVIVQIFQRERGPASAAPR